jgi:hypothetical protein
MSFLLSINLELFNMVRRQLEPVMTGRLPQRNLAGPGNIDERIATCDSYGDIANLQRLSVAYRLNRLQL